MLDIFYFFFFFFFSSRRRHTRCDRDWSSDVCSSDLHAEGHAALFKPVVPTRIGEVGGPPVRSEQHALRHAIAPHLQRSPEDGDSQSSAEEMRRGGEA